MVNYDFVPENSSDLGCLKNERLEIVEEINPEWLKCKNLYGKCGFVPKNFVTIDDNNSSSNSNCSIKSLPIYEKSKSFIETNKQKYNFELRSQSLTPDIMNKYNKIPPPRPPKPPKQILEPLINSSHKIHEDKKNYENEKINLNGKYLFFQF